MPSSARTRKTRPRLWIADDEPEICQLLNDCLDRGYEVDCFTSLSDLEIRLHTGLPDVLVLDLVFGSEENAGLDLLATLRKRLPCLPVVVISGRADWDAAFAAGSLGASRFVHKSSAGRGFLTNLKEAIDGAVREGTLNAAIANILDELDIFETLTGRQLEDCDTIARRAIEYFLSNISSIGPSVQRISAGIGVSNGTLNSHIKSNFKQTAGDLFTYLAVTLAAKLIRRGYAVSEASKLVGMHPERLRQRFQAEYGVPPSRCHMIPCT